MTSFQYDYIVSKNEAEALKDMIFKRVRDRAEAVANDTNEKYTTSVKYDVMELAHDSFEKSSNNPFAEIAENKENSNKTEVEKSPKTSQIGFSIRKTLKEDLSNKNTTISKDLTEKTIEITMNEARMDFSKNSSFTGALAFLNSQASISLNEKNNKKFDIVV